MPHMSQHSQMGPRKVRHIADCTRRTIWRFENLKHLVSEDCIVQFDIIPTVVLVLKRGGCMVNNTFICHICHSIVKWGSAQVTHHPLPRHITPRKVRHIADCTRRTIWRFENLKHLVYWSSRGGAVW
jgi:hypothetical protein